VIATLSPPALLPKLAAVAPWPYNPSMRDRGRLGDVDPRSILMVAPTWVGDFVMATPMLRAVRERFADAHITLLIEPNLRDLVRGGTWMNDVVAWPAKEVRSPLHKAYRDFGWDLRRRRFDWAVLLPNSFRSALIARWAGATRRIGYDRDGRGLLLTDRLQVKNRRGAASVNFNHREAPALPVKPSRYIPMPIVEYYADLAEAIGCARPDDRLELFTTPDCDGSVEARMQALGMVDRHPLVILSPGAKFGASKCWPVDRFAAVADHLVKAENAAVVVTCGPGEEAIAGAIGDAMNEPVVVLDEDRLSLGELKSLIARADLLLCNDAGPRHFAKAFGVPVVTVFGPTHPEWTDTDYPHERIVRIDVDCGPCQQKACPLGHLECMTGVTVDMVTEACAALIRKRLAPSVG